MPELNATRTCTRLVAALARLGVVVAVAMGVGYVATPASAELFGTQEFRSTNLAPFPKWTGALERYFDERKLGEGPCEITLFNRCQFQEWKRFLTALEGRTRMAQLVEVNQFMNQHRYILDPINWGMPDYWATPGQFLQKDGDCEDYAISKFMSLRALGFDNDQMRIVVLEDLNLRVMHAILVVYMNSRALVLDNRVQQLVPAEIIYHYKPIYSVNEESWWMHRR